MDKYSAVGDTVYDEGGRPVLSISYAPYGNHNKWAERVAGWMNRDHMETIQSQESLNFSKILKDEILPPRSLEDELPAFLAKEADDDDNEPVYFGEATK